MLVWNKWIRISIRDTEIWTENMSKLHFIQSSYKWLLIGDKSTDWKTLQTHQIISIINVAAVSRLITMNYCFTKRICIPSGTGSGMVIPVSPLRCSKTEGLWCLFLLFLPSLLFKALLALKSPTPSSERGAQETQTTPLRSSKRRGRARVW